LWNAVGVVRDEPRDRVQVIQEEHDRGEDDREVLQRRDQDVLDDDAEVVDDPDALLDGGVEPVVPEDRADVVRGEVSAARRDVPRQDLRMNLVPPVEECPGCPFFPPR
jgi:hypothetical protein